MKASVFVAVLALAAGSPAGLSAQSMPLEEAIRLVDEGHFEEAREPLLQLAARRPLDPRAAHYAGRALLALGDADEAVRWLERAAQAEPGSASYQLWLGRAYGTQAQRAGVIRRVGLARKTKATFEQVLVLDPDNLDARSHLIDFHLLAPGILGGDKRRALAYAQEIDGRDPWRGVAELARVHSAMDNDAEAERVLRRALAAYPDSVQAYVNLSLFQQNRERYEDAYQTLRPMLSRTPTVPAAIYQVGRIGAVSGRELDRAEAALRQYLELRPAPGDPPFAAAHWRIGMIREHRGDAAGARAEYETSLRLDPNFGPSTEALRKLR